MASLGDQHLLTNNNRRYSKNRISVEPVLFSLFITGALSDGVITKLLLSRTCIHDIGLPPANCSDILPQKVEANAQEIVAKIIMCKTLIETIIPAILSLFIGPWSDTNGRRTFLISPIIGHGLTYITWAILSLIPNLNPRLFLLACIPITISGGLVGILVSSFCYLSDITNNENRAFRMEIAEASMTSGQLLGFFLSPYIFNSTISWGYITIFLVNASILAINVIYVIFFVPESVNLEQLERRKLFRFDHLRDTYRTVTEERPTFGRAVIFILCAVSALSIIVIEGEFAVRFLSARASLGWRLVDYTTYSTVNLFVILVMSFLGLWILNRVLKIENAILTAGVMLTRVISSVLMSLSTSTIFFYIATNIGCLRSMVGPLIRAQLARLVSPTDVGKVYSFLSTVEAITPQVSSPLYMNIYSAVVHTNPFSIYYLSAVICLLSTFLMMTIRCLQTRRQ